MYLANFKGNDNKKLEWGGCGLNRVRWLEPRKMAYGVKRIGFHGNLCALSPW